MSISNLDSLNSLLEQLRAAVDSGDAARARQLAQTLLQRCAAAAAELKAIEREVRSLLARLDLVHLGATRGGDKGEIEEGTRGVAYGIPKPDDDVVYPVFFGTNRKPAAGDAASFTNERHSEITRGRVLVHIPEAHRFGETGSSFWKRMLRFDLRSDQLRIQQVEKRDRDAFFAEITAAMAAARESGKSPHALFFLHGYNTTFEDAAIRAAQIGFDLNVPGATAFFSWPSRGAMHAYTADEAAIEASEKAITDFLVDFTGNCGADKVHVIAHSMGNRGFLRALQRIAANAETRGKVRFGQIFLAAPDLDRDLFLDLARLYPEHSERTTLYASRGDKAVFLSAAVHDAPRAGYFEPYTVAPGVDTVAVPNFNVDLLGHSYFAQAEALLHDIFDLMRDGRAPTERQRLVPAQADGATFWKLRR